MSCSPPRASPSEGARGQWWLHTSTSRGAVLAQLLTGANRSMQSTIVCRRIVCRRDDTEAQAHTSRSAQSGHRHGLILAPTHVATQQHRWMQMQPPQARVWHSRLNRREHGLHETGGERMLCISPVAAGRALNGQWPGPRGPPLAPGAWACMVIGRRVTRGGSRCDAGASRVRQTANHAVVALTCDTRYTHTVFRLRAAAPRGDWTGA